MRRRLPERPVTDFLPLTPAIAHILLALADEDRHGYAIMQEVAKLTDNATRMGPGTLYGTIKRLLPPEARVGTVDKFQGQEAPISIYSLTTSTPELAPRGMDFLYSRHRLNVATSRARCISVVVASPDLFRVRARTPEQMRLANAFCRFAELAPERLKVSPR